jgi:hypothetical protein
MADDEHRSPDEDVTEALAELGQKLDTVAGAVAAVASTHIEVLAQVAEAEVRRSQDAHEVAQRLEAVERQILAMPTPVPPPPGAPGTEPAAQVDLEPLRADIALSLEVLARVTEAVERLDSRTEDRLAAVRDAALAPVSDLQALLAARNERHDAQLASLVTAVDALAAQGPAPIREQLAELAAGVEALALGMGGDRQETAAVGPPGDQLDVTGALEELADELTRHTDTALAAALRLIDERLTALRNALPAEGSAAASNLGGFEAGAVMGAAQAAWNRLEQRLDSEFDDLGRQLQAIAALIEQAVATTEAVANRPVVTGDQLRRAASAVKDTVVGAGRSRRDRRGGPRGLSSGH